MCWFCFAFRAVFVFVAGIPLAAAVCYCCRCYCRCPEVAIRVVGQQQQRKKKRTGRERERLVDDQMTNGKASTEVGLILFVCNSCCCIQGNKYIEDREIEERATGYRQSPGKRLLRSVLSVPFRKRTRIASC